MANTGVKPTFFKISQLELQSHAGQMKRKVNCGELSVEKTLLGLPHIVKAAFEPWSDPSIKLSSTIVNSIVNSTRAMLRDGCHAKTSILRSAVITRMNLETCIII